MWEIMAKSTGILSWVYGNMDTKNISTYEIVFSN